MNSLSNNMSATDLEYAKRRKTTKVQIFLEKMDQSIPWEDWLAIIRPYYYPGKFGRPPIDLEIMLRMYLVQVWFNLSDEDTEESIYECYSIKKFVGIDFNERQAPDATTLQHFRALMVRHGLDKKLFENVTDRLDRGGLMAHGGTVGDSTMIAAPSSTKNRSKSRDPEMHSTKKGNNYYFGMKAHVGQDVMTGYVHTVTVTPANVHDVAEAANLIRPDDEKFHGDSGYTGIDKRPEIMADEHLSSMEYEIVAKPSSLRITPEYDGFNWDRYIESRKASVRCKVEHAFHILKNQFKFRKTHYRGLQKNLSRLYMLFASINIVMCSRAGRIREFLGA